MNQREKIANRFSDAYIVAKLTGADASEVLQQYTNDFPELTAEFTSNARSLNILYGDLSLASKPTAAEIADAYKQVAERFGTVPTRTAINSAPERLSFFAQLRENFRSSPRWTGASLGIGLAVVIALLWQPWVVKESMKQSAQSGTAPGAMQQTQNPELAANDQGSNDPTKTPEVKFRGKTEKELLTPAQRNQQDSLDDAKLKAMTVPKPLTAPGGIELEPLGQGSIMIHWSAVDDALSYILEMRSATDDSFVPVTQISQTKARITHLKSGETYLVRLIAASGERKGPASEAKSIVVP